jgi:hypothetical protein
LIECRIVGSIPADSNRRLHSRHQAHETWTRRHENSSADIAIADLKKKKNCRILDQVRKKILRLREKAAQRLQWIGELKSEK